MNQIGEHRLLPAALILLLGVVLLVLPGTSGSLLASAPLEWPGRLLLVLLSAAVVGTVAFRVPRIGTGYTAALVTLIAIKGGMALADRPEGWVLQVTPELPAGHRVMSFWRFGAHPYRIVPTIDVSGSSFGLHFFNDLQYNAPGIPDGERPIVLSWQARWRGHVHRLGAGMVEGTVTGLGRVRVLLGGVVLLDAENPQAAVVRFPALQDSALVDVEYDKPRDTSGNLRFTWSPSAAVAVRPYSGQSPDAGSQRLRALLDAAVTLLGVVIAIGAVVRSAWATAVPRWGASVFLTTTVVAGYLLIASGGLVVAQRYAGTVYYMSVGNDPIQYEGFARDIMANGPLMLAGQPLGQAPPYYFYPLYPYVMALAHWVIGEDASAVMVLNALLVATVLPLLWALGWWQLPVRAASIALLVAIWFLCIHALPYAREVFTDNLFLPLVLLCLNVGTRAMRQGRPTFWLMTGWLIALAAATRPSLLTYLPVLGLGIVLANGLRRLPTSLWTGLLLGVGFTLGVAPFTIRNYVVSGHFVMLVNSWVQLAVFLIPPGESYAHIYHGQVVGLRETLGWVFDIVTQHPWRSLMLEIRKILFTFGFTALGHGPGTTSHPEFLVFSLAGLAALWRRRIDPPLLVVTGSFVVAHVLAMVMAMPWSYGYKSILPLQAVFLFWGAWLAGGAGAPASTRERA